MTQDEFDINPDNIKNIHLWEKIKSNKKKIWIYGDSYSFPTSHTVFTQEYYSKLERFDSRCHADKFWFNYIGDDRKLIPIILSKGGHSNSWILRSILRTMKYWTTEDEIYIGHTYPHRIEIPMNNHFERISNQISSIDLSKEYPWVDDFYESWIFSPNCQMEFWDNLNDIVDFGHSNGFKIKSWFWGNYFHKLESFKTLTNGEINDDHPSPKGHFDLYNIIENMSWGDTSEIFENYNPRVDGLNFHERNNLIISFFKKNKLS